MACNLVSQSLIQLAVLISRQIGPNFIVIHFFPPRFPRASSSDFRGREITATQRSKPRQKEHCRSPSRKVLHSPSKAGPLSVFPEGAQRHPSISLSAPTHPQGLALQVRSPSLQLYRQSGTIASCAKSRSPTSCKRF